MYIHVCVGVMAVTAGGRPVREVGEHWVTVGIW